MYLSSFSFVYLCKICAVGNVLLSGADDGRSGGIMYSVIGSSQAQHLNHAFNGSPSNIITYQFDINMMEVNISTVDVL